MTKPRRGGAALSVDFWNTLLVASPRARRSFAGRIAGVWHRELRAAGVAARPAELHAQALARWAESEERAGRAPSVRRCARWVADRCGVALNIARVERALDAQALRGPYRLAPGARAALVRLRNVGFRTALVSTVVSQTPRAIERLLRRERMHRLFDARFLSSEHPFSKPDPRAISTVLRTLGVERRNAAHIGDLPYDWSAARRAGVVPIRFRPGPGRARTPYDVRNWREVTPARLARWGIVPLTEPAGRSPRHGAAGSSASPSARPRRAG